MSTSNGIKMIPVEGKNGLYRIEMSCDNQKKSLSIPEISKIIRKPIPKITEKK
jgi:hypothetical protein